MANSCQKCGIPTGSLEYFTSKIAQQGTTEASNQPGPEKVSLAQSQQGKREDPPQGDSELRQVLKSLCKSTFMTAKDRVSQTS